MKFWAGVIAGVGLAVLLALGGAWLIPWWLERPPSVKDGTTLVLALSGPIPEAPPENLNPFEPPGFTTFSIWDVLRKAAVDKRIRAVLLIPDKPGAGWAKLTEIRNAVARFRQSGKPVMAALRTPSLRDYYVASAAERISLPPGDFADVKGVRVELLYARKALDKFGILPEFEAAGQYKDGADILTRSSMSGQTREVMEGLLDARMRTFTESVAAARKKTAGEVRALIDEGPFLAEEAVAKGLVDATEFRDQTEQALALRLGQKELTKLSAAEYQRVRASSLGLEDGPVIAVLAAEGDILRNPIPYFAEDILDPDSMRRYIREIREDGAIRAVILRIDSPGGDAIASEEILRELRLLAAKKPLIVSMSDVAASGGYAIALAGRRLIAYPETLTGSIGVFYGKLVFTGLYEKLGVTAEVLTRGRHADIDSALRPLTAESRAKLRQMIAKTYESFVGQVAEARGKKREEIERVAQGRVWLGSEAPGNGLVDELGGIDRAIAVAISEARLPKETKPRLALYPPRPGWRDSWERRLRIYSTYPAPTAVWKRMSVVE